jgi:hypothetical protein
MASGSNNVIIKEITSDNSYIAQAVSNNSQSGANQATAAHDTTASHNAASHGAESITPNEVFPHLLGELGDHPGFMVGPYHVADLPVILWDKGLHVYSSPKSMQEPACTRQLRARQSEQTTISLRHSIYL